MKQDNMGYAHSLLPYTVQEQLIQASRYDIAMPPGESLRRARAVETATSLAKIRYPHLFKTEA